MCTPHMKSYCKKYIYILYNTDNDEHQRWIYHRTHFILMVVLETHGFTDFFFFFFKRSFILSLKIKY